MREGTPGIVAPAASVTMTSPMEPCSTSMSIGSFGHIVASPWAVLMVATGFVLVGLRCGAADPPAAPVGMPPEAFGLFGLFEHPTSATPAAPASTARRVNESVMGGVAICPPKRPDDSRPPPGGAAVRVTVFLRFRAQW